MDKVTITINDKIYDMSDYESLADLADTEFEGKELSDYTIEELEEVPKRLYAKVALPCTIKEALEEKSITFDTIFDWANYIEENPQDKKATETYIEVNWMWNSDNFIDSYQGQFDSEEDFAWDYLEEAGYDIDYLENYFDYDEYGEELREDFSDYTPEALADFRQRIGLPPLEEPGSEDYSYGFIGDDEDSESDDSYNEDYIKEAEREYQDFIDEHSFEIRIAGIEDDDDLGRTYINEVYGGVENLSRDTIINFFNIDDFVQYLFYDYIFEDGFVFLNC